MNFRMQFSIYFMQFIWQVPWLPEDACHPWHDANINCVVILGWFTRMSTLGTVICCLGVELPLQTLTTWRQCSGVCLSARMRCYLQSLYQSQPQSGNLHFLTPTNLTNMKKYTKIAEIQLFPAPLPRQTCFGRLLPVVQENFQRTSFVISCS